MKNDKTEPTDDATTKPESKTSNKDKKSFVGKTREAVSQNVNNMIKVN